MGDGKINLLPYRDNVSDESIEILDEVFMQIIASTVVNGEHFINTIVRSSDMNNIDIALTFPMQEEPADPTLPDDQIEILKDAISNYKIPEVKDILGKNLDNSNRLNLASRLFLLHNIHGRLKKPQIGVSILIQNPLHKLLSKSYNFKSDFPKKLQVFTECVKEEKIYFSEQIFVLDDDKWAKFLSQPTSILEIDPEMIEHSARSADGAGIDFHVQLFGAFANICEA